MFLVYIFLQKRQKVSKKSFLTLLAVCLVKNSKKKKLKVFMLNKYLNIAANSSEKNLMISILRFSEPRKENFALDSFITLHGFH